MKSVLYICEEWPNPYKPTWDAQIRCLTDLGLRVSVLQCGEISSKQYERWREERAPLGSIPRFSYPSTLKDAPRHLLGVGFLWRLISRLPFAGSVLRQDKPLKERFLDYLRMSAMPRMRYDYVLVKNLNCASDYSWLPLALRATRSAVYYHGGAVIGVDPWYLKHRKLVFDNFVAFFTNTGYSKRELEGLGCPASKVHAVPVGLDIASERSTRTEYRRDGILNLLSVCRLSEEKGVIYAIQAVEHLVCAGTTNLKLHIVGNGLEEDNLRSYVRTHRLGDWIEFHGHRANREVTERFMPQADVLLNTSFPTPTWVETQCIAIQEAGLARVPAIASNCGGLPEVVSDGETGFLTEPHSVPSIASAIKAMALMDSSDIARMGIAAEEFARNNFDVRMVTAKLIAIMQGTDPKRYID